MKLITSLLMVTMLATGCATSRVAETVGPSGEAICQGLERPARNHAAALASDGGPSAIQSGVALIRGLAAACAYDLGRTE